MDPLYPYLLNTPTLFLQSLSIILEQGETMQEHFSLINVTLKSKASPKDNAVTEFFIGKVLVGKVKPRRPVERDNVVEYHVTCSLPGTNNQLGVHQDHREAEKVLRDTIGKWLESLAV